MAFSKRRTSRRPILIVSVLCVVLFLARYMKNFSYDEPSKAPSRAYGDPDSAQKPTTVTRVRTAWARTTKTIYSTKTEAPAIPPKMARIGSGIQAQNPFLDDEKQHPPLEKHRYRSDGLLEVNPNGGHPIFELIERAEAKWDEKVGKASKTLEEAVKEYKRRYKRDPPLGFDAWWAYVEAMEVQLPDEYDQIYNDVEPFWGMDPNDLQTIQRDWEAHADSYTIGKEEGGIINLVNYTLPGNERTQTDLAGGAFEIMDLLEDVEEFIPPFRAVFSPHDNPNLHTDYELMRLAREAARSGKYIDINQPPEVKLDGWISACDPKSPAWKEPIDFDAKVVPNKTKTFIHDHRSVMDPCQHPSILLQHGQFLSHRKGPVPHRTIIPQFSYCPTMLHHDIMPAMPINWVEDIYPRSDDPEWDDKVDDRLQWRGRNTGIWYGENQRWEDAQRTRLVVWANHGFNENLTIIPPPLDHRRRVGKGIEVKKAKYSPALLDIAFAEEPIGCKPDMCNKLKELFEYRRPQNIKTAGKYKYVIDVDGNGWSSRFKRLITSNSLIFKSTIYPEWYTDRIQPWVHYIPIQNDFSDLYDALVFFRGDPSGDNAHDELARKIATAGRLWSLEFWRKEDLTAYMFRLFLEYARVMSPDREFMSYSPTL